MKVIIFSDSHGNFNPMMKAVEKEEPVDMIIHAGDILADAEDLQAVYAKKNVVYVKGNNDIWDRTAPEDRFFEFGGVKIFLTHGHNYGVKYTSAKVMKKGVELGADVCIFGHTHKSCNEKIGNITIFNPGSAVSTYGVMETFDGDFSLNIYEI